MQSKVAASTEGPLQPKKSTGPFSFFLADNMKSLVHDHKLTHPEAMKKAGVLWNEMTDEAKKPFVERSVGDKKRRELQLEELKSKGYFTLLDGTISTDVVPK